MDTKEEAEVVSGLLPLTIDGKVRSLPELKWRANRAWQERNEASYVELATFPAETPTGQRAMSDVQRDLIRAYDTTGALGDLEDATERELDAIYDRLLEVAYPKASSQTAMLATIAAGAIASVRASSTSGLSPSGTTEAPTILRPRSPIARSSSSTRRRKSGSRKSSENA